MNELNREGVEPMHTAYRQQLSLPRKAPPPPSRAVRPLAQRGTHGHQVEHVHNSVTVGVRLRWRHLLRG